MKPDFEIKLINVRYSLSVGNLSWELYNFEPQKLQTKSVQDGNLLVNTKPANFQDGNLLVNTKPANFLTIFKNYTKNFIKQVLCPDN